MNKAPWLIGGILLLGLVIAYTQELPVMMNYLNIEAFWQTGLSIGLGISALSLIFLFTRPHNKSLPIVEKMQLASVVIFLGFLLLPLFLSYTNRWGISAEQGRRVAVTYESEQARYGSRFGSPKGSLQKANQHILFFFREGRLRRTKGRTPFFPEAEAGDTIELIIVTGRWGFEWVKQG